jgi:hypothetical protein
MLFDAGLPDPFGGILGDVKRRYERFLEKRRSFRYKGKPVKDIVPCQCLGGAGPFTTACNIRGADVFCIDLMIDPQWAHRLLEYLTVSAIARIKAWRSFVKDTQALDFSQGLGIGDDSIALLSPEQFESEILPYHIRIYNELANDGDRGIHLCGDATRHFKVLRDKAGVTASDTGKHRGGFQYIRAFHDIGQLADIAGPGILQESFKHQPVKSADALAVGFVESLGMTSARRSMSSRRSRSGGISTGNTLKR